jgi:hypothetical protein
MAEFVRFQEENPIIHDIPIADKSESYERIAKVAGATADVIAKQVESIGQEQSNAMYLSTQAQLDNYKTQAKTDFLLHPELAQKIAENTTQNYNNAVSSAFVNKGDRTKLQYLASKDINDLKFDSTKAAFELSKRQGMVQLYSSWPDTLKGIKGSIDDPKEFEIRVNSANEAINSALRVGAISPTQGATLFKSIHQVMDAAAARMRVAGGGDVDARKYHMQKGGMISTDDGTHINQPVSETTKQIYDSHNDDNSIQGLKYDLARGNLGNAQAWASLHTEHQVNEATHFGEGAFSVESDIKHGTPITMLSQEYANLTKHSLHSPYESGRMARIKNLLADLGNGQFEAVLKSNPLFQQAETSYNQSRAAIDSSMLPDDKKGALIQSYDNDLVYKKASLGEAMHIPSKDIYPIAPHFTNAAKVSWGLNQDPNALLTHLDYFKPDLREYFAKTQGNPVQQETTRLVGYLQGTRYETDRKDFVLANQTGRNYSELRFGKSDTSSEAIKLKVADAISPSVRKFVSTQINGATRSEALIKMGTNYVYQQALSHGDLTLDNIDTYINKFNSIINSAYPIGEGVNWRINSNDIPTTPAQNDVISDYMIHQANLKMGMGVNPAKHIAAMDSNQLSVVNTPTGRLAVITSDNVPIYDLKFTNDLVVHAQDVVDKRNKMLAESHKTMSISVPAMPYSANIPKEEMQSVEPEEEPSSGIIEKGNIDLSNRPVVKNSDGTESTVKTITTEIDGKTVLLPTIIDGKEVSSKEAVKHYKETGEHMGIFSSEAAADAYDKKLHEEKGWVGVGNKWKNTKGGANKDLSDKEKVKHPHEVAFNKNSVKFESDDEELQAQIDEQNAENEKSLDEANKSAKRAKKSGIYRKALESKKK